MILDQVCNSMQRELQVKDMCLGGGVDLLVSGFHWHELQLAPENSLPCDPSITSVVLVIESGKLDTYMYVYIK